MNSALAGKVALVTGGSMGIGKAIARRLLGDGATVVLAARTRATLEAAASELAQATQGEARVSWHEADTTQQASVDALAAWAESAHGRVDILVNCAANPGGVVRNDVAHLDAQALLGDLNTKVVGYARCARAFVGGMSRRHWGRIINIGGLTGRDSATLSGMRNAAVCHLTKTLSDQLGPSGITINAIHPGVVRTPHIVELFASQAAARGVTPQQVEAGWVSQTPIRRLIEPEEVGGLVAFLASDAAGAITGESIAIDGGITRGVRL
ncbi:MAG: SDR family oxidoreductase [Proteobacteria bacterium]|nr:SDR family oxidoreductase [Pseudomonadota bacterium]